MKILIPYFPILGTSSYPDHYTLFQGMDMITFQGEDYYLTDYSGDKNLETRATYAEYEAWLDAQPPVTGVREITTAAFRRRFTVAERRTISRHVDFEVQDYWIDITMRPSIKLDDPAIRAYLEYFVNPFEGQAVLLTAGRIDELLVDGTEFEELSIRTTS